MTPAQSLLALSRVCSVFEDADERWRGVWEDGRFLLIRQRMALRWLQNCRKICAISISCCCICCTVSGETIVIVAWYIVACRVSSSGQGTKESTRAQGHTAHGWKLAAMAKWTKPAAARPSAVSAAMLRLRWRYTSADTDLNLRIIVKRNKLLGSEQVFLEAVASRAIAFLWHKVLSTTRLSGGYAVSRAGLAPHHYLFSNRSQFSSTLTVFLVCTCMTSHTLPQSGFSTAAFMLFQASVGLTIIKPFPSVPVPGGCAPYMGTSLTSPLITSMRLPPLIGINSPLAFAISFSVQILYIYSWRKWTERRGENESLPLALPLQV